MNMLSFELWRGVSTIRGDAWHHICSSFGKRRVDDGPSSIVACLYLVRSSKPLLYTARLPLSLSLWPFCTLVLELLTFRRPYSIVFRLPSIDSIYLRVGTTEHAASLSYLPIYAGQPEEETAKGCSPGQQTNKRTIEPTKQFIRIHSGFSFSCLRRPCSSRQPRQWPLLTTQQASLPVGCTLPVSFLAECTS